MAAAKPVPHRTSDVTNWVLTSIAASLLFHVLMVHFFGGVSFFDTAVFKSAVTRWFNIVDLPLPQPPDFSTAMGTVPTQADQPPSGEANPNDVPLIGPEPRMASPVLGSDPSPGIPTHQPVQVRLPDTNLPVVHSLGPPDVDQTLTQVGEVAPVPTMVREAPPASVPRPMATAAPDLPALPRVSVALPTAAPPPMPAAGGPAGDLAPPTVKASTTQALAADLPPAGIEIPVEEAATSAWTASIPPAPRVVIKPTGEAQEPPREEPGPVVPLADEVGVKVTLYAEPADPCQYFRMEIRVAKPDQLPVIPKDVIFIVDVSLSIRRHELRLVREAIVDYLRTLRPPDRFNVVVFSSNVRKLFPAFTEPSPQRVAAAETFIDRISGQIRTDVYGVLTAVIRDIGQNTTESRPTNIFFVSDGYSTSGIRDARRIVNEISSLARPNFAIFPFDTGRASNRYLLDLLAYRTRGQVTFTESTDEAAKAAPTLFRSFDKPVLMDLRPLFKNLQVEDTYPAFLPNLYADQPIVFYGRCTPGQQVTVQLQGTNPVARRSFVYSQAPGTPDPSQSEIAREWARRKIHHIVSDMARHGESADLKAEIQRLGAKYRVHTPYGP